MHPSPSSPGGVSVGVGVVGGGSGVSVGVAVGVDVTGGSVGVGVGVAVGGTGVSVGGAGVDVGVSVGIGVSVGAGVDVGIRVAVDDDISVGVSDGCGVVLGVAVLMTVGEADGVMLGMIVAVDDERVGVEVKVSKPGISSIPVQEEFEASVSEFSEVESDSVTTAQKAFELCPDSSGAVMVIYPITIAPNIDRRTKGFRVREVSLLSKYTPTKIKKTGLIGIIPKKRGDKRRQSDKLKHV